jgi:uncharacterized phage-like protein YoqJ
MSFQDRFNSALSLQEITCGFTGHRPLSIGGYDRDNPLALAIKARVKEQCIILIEQHNVSRFISGGALGVDQLCYDVVRELKEVYLHIQNIVAVPYSDQGENWVDPDSLTYYQQQLADADEVIHVDTVPFYARTKVKVGEHHDKKLLIRNEHMVDSSKYTIAVYDDSPLGGTAHCFGYAKKKNRTIFQINPKRVRLEMQKELEDKRMAERNKPDSEALPY